MANLLNSISKIVTNALVLIGLFVIVNSIIHGIKLAQSEEARQYIWQDKLFLSLRFVIIDVPIVLPLFILKFLHDIVRDESGVYFIFVRHSCIPIPFLSISEIKK